METVSAVQSLFVVGIGIPCLRTFTILCVNFSRAQYLLYLRNYYLGISGVSGIVPSLRHAREVDTIGITFPADGENGETEPPESQHAAGHQLSGKSTKILTPAVNFRAPEPPGGRHSSAAWTAAQLHNRFLSRTVSADSQRSPGQRRRPPVISSGEGGPEAEHQRISTRCWWASLSSTDPASTSRA